MKPGDPSLMSEPRNQVADRAETVRQARQRLTNFVPQLKLAVREARKAIPRGLGENKLSMGHLQLAIVASMLDNTVRILGMFELEQFIKDLDVLVSSGE